MRADDIREEDWARAVRAMHRNRESAFILEGTGRLQ